MVNKKYSKNKIRYCVPAPDDEIESINDIPPDCHFSKESINGFVGLGEILRTIHNRLIKEGYSIIDGKLISPKGKTLYERKSTTTT